MMRKCIEFNFKQNLFSFYFLFFFSFYSFILLLQLENGKIGKFGKKKTDSDPKESDYILASRIIQTWLFQSNRSNDNMREPLDLPFEHGHVEIIFQHEKAPKDSDWIAVCG